MPNRIIKESIRTSKKVNLLSDFEFRFWTYLITYVDDYGRGSADAELLKGFVFPRRPDITLDTITRTINALASCGMIFLYEADGEKYFYFPNWENHQQIRAKKGKFPAPANVCNHVISNDLTCSVNPIQSNTNPNTNPNTNTESNFELNAQEREAERNDLGRVFCYYEKVTGTLPNPYMVEHFKQFTAKLGADVTIHGIDAALAEGKTTPKYIKAILSRYEREGLNTMERVLQSEREFEARKVERDNRNVRKNDSNGNNGKSWNLSGGTVFDPDEPCSDES